MSTHPHTNLFTQVDRTKDPDFFVRFMDEAQKPPAIQASKQLMLERIALAPGEAVLDVGCGPGTAVFDMVELVGPAGRLVGLDASEVMIAEARRRARELHVPIIFEVGEAKALPFPDGTFDVCRAERLLEHLPDAEQALAEMVRVTHPGGRILVFDFDWDTLIIDHPDKETTRTIVRSFLRLDTKRLDRPAAAAPVQRAAPGGALPRSRAGLRPLRADRAIVRQPSRPAPGKRNAVTRPGTAVVGVPATRRQGGGAAGQLHDLHHRRREEIAIKRRRCAAPGRASAPPLSLGRPARRTPGHTFTAPRSIRLIRSSFNARCWRC